MIAQAGVSFVDQWFGNYWLVLVVKAGIVLVFFLVAPLGIGYMEHKVLAHMQARLGPMYAGGFHGWAQLMADGVKFIQKEDIIPAAADRWVFSIAPAVALVPYIALFVVVPFSDEIFILNLDVGIFFVLAITVGHRDRRADGGMGVGEQVLVDRRVPRSRSTDRVRVAARARRGGRRDAGGHALDDRDRRGTGALLVRRSRSRSGSASSSWPRSPSSRDRRSTCRWPTPRSSSGPYTEYTGLKFAFFLLAEYGGIVALSAVASRAVPRRVPGGSVPRIHPRTAVDGGEDRRPVVLHHLAAGHVPAPAGGPAPAGLVAHADPARPAADHGRRRSSRSRSRAKRQRHRRLCGDRRTGRAEIPRRCGGPVSAW